MNNCIKAFSIDNPSPVTFYKVSGILEQKQGELSQRISLNAINKILVENSKAGYSVSLVCKDAEGCVSLLKADMTSSNMGSTVFFFNNPAAANTFAQHTSSIIIQINENEPIETILFKTAEGQTPLLPSIVANEPTAIPKATPNKEVDENNNEVEPKEPKEIKKTTKPAPKKAKEEIEDEEEPKEEKEVKSTSKSKKSKVESNNENEENTAVSKNDFCAQLLSIVASGAEKGFKDIEGSETNAEKKINDSKVKLKGAKRNYLSWFKEKRAFISEIKILNDNNEAVIAFEELQNTLDECLANGWDDNDHSLDSMYENASYEVKDVEYSKGGDMNKPTIRISIVPDGKRFILFVRVR